MASKEVVDCLEINDKKKTKSKGRCKSLIIDGGKYKTYFNQKFINRKKWQPQNEKHVVSYIPGTIKSLNIKEGDKVKKGDLLLEFEAMKMLNTLISPLSGVVKKINVKLEDKVPKGYLMLEFK